MLIDKEAQDHTSLHLTEREGEHIREIILTKIDCSWSYYLRNRVGMSPPNVHAYLSGKKPISFRNLKKLLSGTDVEASCQTVVTLENTRGGIVETADSIPLEEMLSSPEAEESFEENDHSPPTSDSFSSARGREKQRMQQAIQWLGKPEDSSES